MPAHTRSHVASHAGTHVPAPAAPAEPSEFITNGAFAADTDWTKGGGWTISGGVATNDGSGGILSQVFSTALISGNDYTLSGTLGNAVAETITLRVRPGAGGVAQNVLVTTSDGAFSQGFTANANHDRIEIVDAGVAADVVTIDNVSLVP